MRFIALLLLFWLPAIGFTQSSTERSRAGYFASEIQGLMIFPDVQSGQEYTEGLIDYGLMSRVVRFVPIGKRVSLTAGLGLSLWNIRQENTYEIYRYEQFPANRDEPNYYHTTEFTQLSLELPLALRFHAIDLPSGNIYVKGGTSLTIPLFDAHWSYRNYRGDINREPSLFPNGDVNNRVGHLLSTGIGYLFTDFNAVNVYFEVDYTWSTNAVIERGAERDKSNRLNYVRDSGIRQVSILVGTSF